MPEQIILERKLGDAFIKAKVEYDCMSVEMSVDAFYNELEKRVIANLPSLRFDMSDSSIREKVREAFRVSWSDLTKTFKDSLVSAVR